MLIFSETMKMNILTNSEELSKIINKFVKLKETNGKVTLDELRSYLDKEVPKLSLIENSLKQTPQVLVAPDIADKWPAWDWR